MKKVGVMTEREVSSTEVSLEDQEKLWDLVLCFSQSSCCHLWILSMDHLLDISFHSLCPGPPGITFYPHTRDLVET